MKCDRDVETMLAQPLNYGVLHRASIEGSLKGLAEAAPAEPASMQDLTGGLEGAKQHVAETVAVANEQISSLAGVVKSETNDLSSQVLHLECVIQFNMNGADCYSQSNVRCGPAGPLGGSEGCL